MENTGGSVRGSTTPAPWEWLPLALLCLVALALRLSLIDDFLGFSADMASYLMTRNWVLGVDPTGHMPAHFRPPLIGVLLLPFTATMGDLMGSKVLALLSSVTMGVPFYFLARRFVPPGLAIIGSFAFIYHPFFADIAAWNYVTLLVFPLVIWSMIALFRIIEGSGAFWELIPPTILLVGFNQTVSLITALILGSMIVASPDQRRKATIATALGYTASLVWLPFYLPHTPGHGLVLPGAGLVNFRLDLLATLQGVIILACIPLAGWSRLRVVAVPGVVLAAISNTWSGDVVLSNAMTRASYILPLFPILTVLITVNSLLDRKAFSGAIRTVPAMAIVSGALLVGTLPAHQIWQGKFYASAQRLNILTPDNLQALHWLRQNTPTDTRVLAHPMGLAWYVAGYVPRDARGTWWSPPLRLHESEHQGFLCAMAWKGDGCDPYQLNHSLGFRYIVVDRSSWQGINGMPPDGWEITAVKASWLEEVYTRGKVTVWRWRDC